jgi:hypothetical protein
MSSGAILLLVGFALRYFAKRARFMSRNEYGVVIRRSYEDALWFNAWTYGAIWIGVGLMMLGVLFFFGGVS